MNGYYSMDKENIGDIPIKVLIERAWSIEYTVNILKFLPKVHDYSAFEAIMEIPITFDVHSEFINDSLVYVQTESYYADVNALRLDMGQLQKALRLFLLVMKIGIPNSAMNLEKFDRETDYLSEKMMRLKWAAAEGPQPADFDEDTAYAIMQAAYYMLFNYCTNKADFLELGHNMRVNFKSDLNYILSSAWSGINGWRV